LDALPVNTQLICTFLAVVVGCSAPVHHPPPSESPPSSLSDHTTPPGPLLLARGGRWIVVGLPSARGRGEKLYALSAEPVSGTEHIPVGVVTITAASVTSSGAHMVAWQCKPGPADYEAARSTGLPVIEVHPDMPIRLGACWSRYQNRPEDWKTDTGFVDLTVMVGKDDGVEAGDVFEVLGEPHVDEQGRLVTDYPRIAHCTVVAHEISSLSARCRLHLGDWPAFNRERWLRGGFVQLASPAHEAAP
jgi:hypothetical protein